MEPVCLRRAGDRHDPRLLREHPGEGDLCGRGVLPPSDRGQQINQRLIGFARFRREARERAAEVRAVERRVLVDGAREEALAERTERHEPDAERFECWQNVLFVLSGPQRVFALHGGDRLHRVCTTDRARARLGQTEVLHLACGNQVADSSRHIFDGHVWIDAVLVEQIDRVDPEPLQRSFDGLADVRRLAVETNPLRAAVRIELEAELRGDDDPIAEWLERFAHEVFVGARAVHLRRIEERDAFVDGRANQLDHRLAIRSRAVGETHAHATEAKGGHFETGAKRSRLHLNSPQERVSSLAALSRTRSLSYRTRFVSRIHEWQTTI